MKLTLSVQAFVASVTMSPGWRKMKIKEVTREQNKAKTGMNTVILWNVDNGMLPSHEPDIREMKQWYSDAYPANWVPLLEAIFDKKYDVQTFTEDFEFDPMQFIGTEVWGEILVAPVLDQNTKKDTGRIQNNIGQMMNIEKSPV